MRILFILFMFIITILFSYINAQNTINNNENFTNNNVETINPVILLTCSVN